MADTGKAVSGAASGAAAGTAILPGWGTAIGGAIGLVGGLIGSDAASGDRDAARRAAAAAYQQLASINVPADLAQEIILQQFKQAGILTPDLEQQISAGPSAFQDLKVDQTGRNAQLEALQAMQQVGKTGIRPEDMAALNQIRQQMAQDTESKRQQIIQSYQQRGLGGSGAELAAQLQASQSGSNQASQQGDQLASQASQRALQALQSTGSMGGQLNQQDTSLASAKANAADQFKQFDTQNQIGRQQRNISTANQAQSANLGNLQSISNSNVNQANQELARQKVAQQQTFDDQMRLGQARANALLGQASNLNDQADKTAQGWTNIGAGAGMIGNSLYNAFSSSGKDTKTKDPENAAHGGKVPGHRIVPGDSEINDTKPYMLSPDEVVLPASIAKSDKLHEVHTFLRNLELNKGKK